MQPSHEPWPVRRLAVISGVSQAHFARALKAAIGLLPHRYLLTRRIGRAKALVHDTDLSVIDIAFQTRWETCTGSSSRSRIRVPF